MRLIPSLLLITVLTGCTAVPKDLFTAGPKSMERRQVETRKFTGVKEAVLLASCGAIVQDLGFTLEGSETKLGLITANKNRDAVQTAEVVAAVIVALLGGGSTPISRDQMIRVSIVALPTADKVPDSWVVRTTFQRIVTRTDNTVIAEALTDPALHTEFFDKLSKAIFLEAQKL